jgi:hypothetical protein
MQKTIISENPKKRVIYIVDVNEPCKRIESPGNPRVRRKRASHPLKFGVFNRGCFRMMMTKE